VSRAGHRRAAISHSVTFSRCCSDPVRATEEGTEHVAQRRHRLERADREVRGSDVLSLGRMPSRFSKPWDGLGPVMSGCGGQGTSPFRGRCSSVIPPVSGLHAGFTTDSASPGPRQRPRGREVARVPNRRAQLRAWPAERSGDVYSSAHDDIGSGRAGSRSHSGWLGGRRRRGRVVVALRIE